MSDKKFASVNMNTPKCRISFPAVFEPKDDLQGKPKYGAELLFDKDTTDFTQMKAAVAKVIKDTWGEKPDGLKLPFKDGDEKLRGGKALQGYANAIVISAKSIQKPVVVDESRNEFINTAEFYPGVTAIANVTFKAYNARGNKGVTCYLQALQRTCFGKSDSFGQRFNANDAFDVIESFDGGAGAGAPAMQDDGFDF